ncbi:hypothetical protein PR048_017570, partial [Dryococelus australis]
MIRGLFVGWKQPIFYGFDVTMPTCGITLVAVTCDMGGKNSKVWKELCVNTDKPYFANPVCGDRKIWIFYDIPHLLKLSRNHFINSVTLPDGTVFTKASIKELLNHQKGDLSITLPHFGNSTECYRMCTLVAQLFSRRTAQAFNYLLGKKRECIFVKLINDVINSRLPTDEKTPLQSGYGIHHRSQENTLKTFSEVCPVLCFGKRNSLLLFQKGSIISMKSLMGLYEDLKKNECSIHFDFQIVLSTFFRDFAALECFTTAFEVRNRIRLLVLTGSASDIPLSKRASVQEEKNYCSSTQCSFDTEDQFTELVSSELCIKITVCVSRCQEPTNEGKKVVELLHHEVSTDLLESTPDTDITLEALKYVAGYMAFNCKNIDSSLGSFQEKCDSNVPSDWISIISRGGLKTPSSEWLDIARQFEIVFAAFHGTELSKSTKLHEKFSELNEKFLRVYVRTRTFIRIRHLDYKMKISAIKKSHVVSVLFSKT